MDFILYEICITDVDIYCYIFNQILTLTKSEPNVNKNKESTYLSTLQYIFSKQLVS
jgi:hypothetical protein